MGEVREKSGREAWDEMKRELESRSSQEEKRGWFGDILRPEFWMGLYVVFYLLGKKEPVEGLAERGGGN